MRGSISRWLVAGLFLATLSVTLPASCGSPSATPQAEWPMRHEPALQPAALESLQAAGPLPEYRLALELDAGARRLAGREQIRVANSTGVPLDEIVLRLYPNLRQYDGHLSVGRVWIDGKRANTSLRAADTALAISLPNTLAPNASTTISLTFDVEIPEKEGGHALFSHSQGMWSVPDAYPMLAVRDEAGWHEDIAPPHGDAVFAQAARYDASLLLPADLVLATTGVIVSDTLQASGGTHLYWISGDGLREFAWFASPNYAVAESQVGNVRLLSYYLKGDEGEGQAALAVGAAALGAYGDGFGAYPFTEMKVVEGPITYFGMEYPGLTLIGLELYRDRSDQFEIRVAHEFAHEWWYAQVGNDQVNVPWLDEGLAEFSTFIYYQQVYGQAQANTLVNQRWQVPYQVAVDNGLDAIVNQPSSAFGPNNYEVIVYAKAALFFYTLHQQLGPETFDRVLRAYLDRYRWRIATPDDFLSVADQVSGQKLEGLYTQWILSKR